MTENEFAGHVTESDQSAVSRVPLESYLTVKTREAHETVRKISSRPLRQAIWKTLSVFAAAALLTSLIYREDHTPWLAFYFGAALAYCSMHGATLRNYKKRWADGVARAEGSEYLTEIFEDGYRVTVTRDGEETLRFFTTWDRVQGAWQTPEYLIFYNDIMVHYLPVAELPSDSRLFAALSAKLKSTKGQKTTSDAKRNEQSLLSRRQGLSKLLAVLSALSLVASLVIFPMMLWMPHRISLPIFVLLLLFPILCLIYDGIWNRGGRNRRSNRTLCILAIVIIAVVAVGVFFLSEVLDDIRGVEDPTLAYELAQTAKVDLPPNLAMISSIEISDPSDLTNPIQMYYRGVLDLEDEAETFAEQVKSDPRWLSPLPTELRGLLPDFAVSNTRIPDYVLFYRITDQSYNNLPSDMGSYRYLCFIYHEQSGLLEIYHYDLIRAVAPTS